MVMLTRKSSIGGNLWTMLWIISSEKKISQILIYVQVQVKLFSETLTNIFMNFVPNKLIIVDDRCFIT